MAHRKNLLQLEKCVTARKMGHSHKNGSELEKCVTVTKYTSFRKLGYYYKNGLGSLKKMLYN